jgi:hypothetical protein
MIECAPRSWNQSWTGGDQIRLFKIEGDTLTITTSINKIRATAGTGAASRVHESSVVA